MQSIFFYSLTIHTDSRYHICRSRRRVNTAKCTLFCNSRSGWQFHWLLPIPLYPSLNKEARECTGVTTSRQWRSAVLMAPAILVVLRSRLQRVITVEVMDARPTRPDAPSTRNAAEIASLVRAKTG